MPDTCPTCKGPCRGHSAVGWSPPDPTAPVSDGPVGGESWTLEADTQGVRHVVSGPPIPAFERVEVVRRGDYDDLRETYESLAETFRAQAGDWANAERRAAGLEERLASQREATVADVCETLVTGAHSLEATRHPEAEIEAAALRNAAGWLRDQYSIEKGFGASRERDR